MALMEFLAGHRTAFLTQFFLAVTAFGDVGGYILIATLIYVAWDKQLAVRLAVLLLATMALNDILKLVIKNPRPFVREGTYPQKWAVPAKNARKLAAQYSTPSGHAMACGAFYSYLYALISNKCVRVMAVIAILLIGLSRPYLGVHYGEDILLGWALGLAAALLAIRYAEAIPTAWGRLTHGRQIGVAVAASLALWLLAVLLNGGRSEGQPRDFLCYGGFLTGIVLARPLELKLVNFDPRSSTAFVKILRYLLSAGMIACTLLLLGWLSAMLTDSAALLGSLLEYLRFTAAGFVTIFLAPLLFTRIGWATSALQPAK
jgi:membrane-associated phospholipid phosphatase